MNWMTADLADVTDRRAGRAAVVLTVAYLGVALGAWLLWGFGHLFTQARWVPIVLVCTFAAVGTFGLMLRFGFWPIARHDGRGEEYTRTFSPVSGFFLGLWRLLCSSSSPSCSFPPWR